MPHPRSRRLNVALVGAGIARAHAEAYASLPDLFALRAICSLDQDRGQALARDFAVPHTTAYDALLADSSIDIVDICTPPHLHFAQARRAIETHHHVVCEKPLFATLAQFDAMEALLARTDRRLMPIFQYRFGRGFRKLQHLQALDLTGRPLLATVETHWRRGPDYYSVPWRGRRDTELGGALTTHAIHAHDLLLAILGPVDTVLALTATLSNPIETEDTAVASLRFQSGALAALSTTLGAATEISRLRFCFEHLTAESNHSPYAPARDPWRFEATDPARQPALDDALNDVPDTTDGYRRQFELLHTALTTGTPLPVTIDDARRSFELLDAIYHSADKARGVVRSTPPA